MPVAQFGATTGRGCADLVGVDRDRLLLWLLARCIQESPQWPALAEIARTIAPG